MTLSYRLSTRRFGELLVERERLTSEQLNQALTSRQDPRERLGQTLVRLGLLDEGDVVELLGQQFSLPIADADQLGKAEREAVELVPEHLARQAGLLALRREGTTLEVAVGDPLDVVSLDHLRALTEVVAQGSFTRAAGSPEKSWAFRMTSSVRSRAGSHQKPRTQPSSSAVPPGRGAKTISPGATIPRHARASRSSSTGSLSLEIWARRSPFSS